MQHDPTVTVAAPGVMLPHLRAWRLARGLTVRELARRAYCSRAYIYLLENAQCGASRRFIPLLALALDVDPATLMQRAPAARRAARSAAGVPDTVIAPVAAHEGPAMAARMT